MRNTFKVSLATAAVTLAAFGVNQSRASVITLISPGTNTQTNTGSVVAGNGNFDQAPISSNSYPSTVPGWASTGGQFQYNPTGSDNGNYSAPNIFALNLNRTGTLTSVPSGASIPYSYSTGAGDVFTVSYWGADNNGKATGSTLNVTAELIFGSNTYTVIPTTDFTSQTYTQATGTFTAVGADVGITPWVKLLLANSSTSSTSDSQLQIDSVGLSVAPFSSVPEPASLGLVAVGAMGLLLLKRRNKPAA